MLDFVFRKKVEDIDPFELRNQGIKVIVCDFDYTLVPRWKKEPSSRVCTWILVCEDAGLSFVIVSNCRFDKRVRRFCETFPSLSYFSRARKPKTESLLKVLETYNVSIDEVVVIGDKIFTDMLYAKRAGALGIKVDRRRSL